jgi:hypothetical protein
LDLLASTRDEPQLEPHGQIDTILLGAFRSGADVAYYVAGSRLAALLWCRC